MLQMMKALNERKNRKHKSKRRETEIINDSSEIISFSEDSESSTEVRQKPRIMRPRPLPPPTPYDPLVDSEKLEKLINQRRLKNWLKFSKVVLGNKYILEYYKELIQTKTDQLNKQFLPIYQQFVNDVYTWAQKILKTTIEALMKTPKLNFQVVPIADKKIAPKQLGLNSQQIKDYIKMILKQIDDNTTDDQITESMKYFFTLFSDYKPLPNNILLKYEFNRFNFNKIGRYIQDSKPKRYMMYCINILNKIVILMVLGKLPSQFPANLFTEQTKINIKTLASVLNELILIWLSGFTAAQQENTKGIDVQKLPVEKKPSYIKMDFEATKEEEARLQEAVKSGLDQPILYPLFSARQMGEFFDNQRQFVNNEIGGTLEGWCDRFDALVQGYKSQADQEDEEEKKKQLEEYARPYNMKKAGMMNKLKERKERFAQLNTDIAELKEKIKQGQDNYIKARQQWEVKQNQRK